MQNAYWCTCPARRPCQGVRRLVFPCSVPDRWVGGTFSAYPSEQRPPGVKLSNIHETQTKHTLGAPCRLDIALDRLGKPPPTETVLPLHLPTANTAVTLSSSVDHSNNPPLPLFCVPLPSHSPPPLPIHILSAHPQGGDSTASYPGCVGSNWREMGPFWTWREGNGVLLYWCISEGLHLYGCVYREFTPIWVYF